MNPDDPFELLDEDEEQNPYAAPRAEIGRARGRGDDNDERIRRQYLSHEASVKSVGYLSALGAALSLLYMFMFISAAIGRGPAFLRAPRNGAPAVVFGALAVFFLGQALLNVAIAYGLIKLQNWARWTTFGLMSFGVFVLFVLTLLGASANKNPGALGGSICALVIPAYIVYLMATPKSGVVCSAEYKEIIARTPHVKYKTSIVVWIFLGLLVLLLVFGVIAGIVASLRR